MIHTTSDPLGCLLLKKKKRQKQVLADNVEKLELMFIAGRNTKVYTRYEKQYGVSSKN